MNNRVLHPVQQQYLDTKDKIAALEIAMLPMKNDMKDLKKQLKEEENALVAWVTTAFPDVSRQIGRQACILLGSHLDAESIPQEVQKNE